MTPGDFPKTFATLFAARDSVGLALLLTDNAQVVTLTSGAADNREAARALFEQEYAGTFATARLVTGKGRTQPIGPGAVVLHQNYVVTGARDSAGQPLPRFAALVTVVLIAVSGGWLAVSLSLSALTQ